ncbi:alpha/beta hydrolase [Hufsiella ginkgonis]|uniref:Phospholipase n=1 Tax=Hufsiella ginkgonis TaxID=2695274 RepID=A0A7K1XY13_9SPHI|nr:dienelactone hydrolase family protein [Hufsiella ginkgonis]MXV15727.1 phospholipase [Hufsiella ginkgonis]
MYTHSKEVLVTGTPVAGAKRAIIMLHGRGDSAGNIQSLARHLELADTAILSPQATNHSWYPYSFMAPVADNQPALDSALALVGEIVGDLQEAGIPPGEVCFLGFSQGACLALEYTTRNAARFGGVIAFTGGLIGQTLNPGNYAGDFAGTPVLITTGDPDPHVPLSRVNETVTVLEKLNASVILKVYKGRAHTVQPVELELARKLVLKTG